MEEKYQLYKISLKVLLEKKNKVLILLDQNDLIDLPGGRIEKKELKSSVEDVIRREIIEELGPDVVFNLGSPIFFFRAYSQKNNEWALIIVHKGEYIKGVISLSKEHKSYKWIEKKKVNIRKKDFYKQDIEKYKVFKKYFSSIK